MGSCTGPVSISCLGAVMKNAGLYLGEVYEIRHYINDAESLGSGEGYALNAGWLLLHIAGSSLCLSPLCTSPNPNRRAARIVVGSQHLSIAAQKMILCSFYSPHVCFNTWRITDINHVGSPCQ